MQRQNKAESVRAGKKENIEIGENSKASETGPLGRKSRNKRLLGARKYQLFTLPEVKQWNLECGGEFGLKEIIQEIELQIG